jgi:acetyltransferase
MYIVPEGVSAAGRNDHPLDVFFAPRRVAIFGATETPGSAGRAVMENMIRHQCGATLFPIHPTRPAVLGIRAYPSLEVTPLPVDLAIVAAPAPAVPDIIGACAVANVQGAIILSAGFRESGPAGAELQQEVVERLRHSRLRVLGPNCLGVACPRTGINATFAPAMPRQGNVAFLSQSGALLAAVLSDDLAAGAGCSAFVSLGAMADLDWTDWLDYLLKDPQTEVIGIYAEQLEDARSFIGAVRRVAPHKPVLLVKGRRHNGKDHERPPLADREDVLENLFRRAGVLRVETLTDMVRMAAMLGTQPTPRGRRVTIISNAGGPAVLASDALLSEGGELAVLAPATTAELDALLPAQRPHQNPIDLRDDADVERFARTVAIAAQDPNSDALVLLLTPQATIDPLRTAELVSRLDTGGDKPVLASWMWGAATPRSLSVLHNAGIPTFAGPEAVVRALGYLWRHGENLHVLRQDSKPAATSAADIDRPAADKMVREARWSGRIRLSGAEARQLLAAYSLPAVETCVATEQAEAIAAANAMGYPVALTPCVAGRPLAADVGILRLHAGNAEAVGRAYHALAGVVRDHLGGMPFEGVKVQPLLAPDAWSLSVRSLIDPQLGPVLQLFACDYPAAAHHEHTIALPPLTRTRVWQLFAQSPLGAMLHRLSVRGLVDLAALAEFLITLSRLVVEQPLIKELCIDTLLVGGERLIALDPLVLLHEAGVLEENLPVMVLRVDPTPSAVGGKVKKRFAVPAIPS